MTDSAVIVGARVIGLATAYRLASDGLQVTVVDAAAESGSGASIHNAGWIVPIMSAPVPAPGMFGKAIWWMLEKDTGVPGGNGTHGADRPHRRPALR
ncbi:FAD-dependent oxidoreductase [Streptomyces sp. RTd22]|uniref:FAD-dependent oxidoreductase n=1 Tax=Streptomyces sp. RTd22 TaxID=1841249 RepID=UPI000A8F2A92|nr:FAD-dependent oxidoreductase [Streptomyces sp. RTd22]